MTLRRATFAASILLAYFPAHAQTVPGNLANLPGLTAIQQPTAIAIQVVCGKLNALSQANEGLPPEQAKLFGSCRKMVQTANEIVDNGPTTYSLGLTNEQLRNAVQGAAPEENSAISNGSINTANPVGGRLVALRAGARGFTLAGNSASKTALASGGAAGETDSDSRLGGFANFNYNRGDLNGSVDEDGFDFVNYGLVAGLDYRFSDSYVAGVALSYNRNEADIDANLGNIDANNVGVSAYASYYKGDGYIDATLSYSRHDFDTVRNIVVPSSDPINVPGINTRAVGNTNGNQLSLSVGGGYDFRRDTITLTPYARLSYLKLDVDSYSETEPVAGLGLDIADQTVKSLQSALGVRLSKTVSASTGVFVPYGALEWVHEFENNSRSITAKYTNDPFNTFFVIPTITPDRDYFVASVGGSSVFANGISAFVTLESVLGLQRVTNTGLTVGLRKEF